ncbi:MAG: hypothetical protein ACI9HE_003803, partial [Planctomycetota bacterium]
ALTDGTTTLSCGEIYNDVWFSFTASVTESHVVSLCGQATHDTKISVYDGSCAGNELACNDDDCGLQSRLKFQANAGQTYILRIGNFTDGSGGTGTFTVIPDLPLVNPATGHAYRIVNNNLDWVSARQEAEATLFMGQPGHLVTIGDQAELDWLLANLDVGRPWIGLFHDTQDPNYAEPASGWAWVTGEPVSFLNWATGEPNDNSASGGSEDYAEMFASGEWNDAELNHAQTNQYLIEWDGGIGTTYCSPAVPNTTGLPGRIEAVGSDIAMDNNLTLRAMDLPLNQFGIFVNSMTAGLIMNPGGSQGNLCVVNSIGRYNGPGEIQTSGVTGSFELLLDLDMTPTPSGSVSIVSGQTWYFQTWYRDFISGQGAVSNFTDAVEILFQ